MNPLFAALPDLLIVGGFAVCLLVFVGFFIKELIEKVRTK